MNPLLLALIGAQAGGSFLSNTFQASQARGAAQSQFRNQQAQGAALNEAFGGFADALRGIDVGLLNDIFGVAGQQRQLVKSGIRKTLPQAAQVSSAANVFNQEAFRDLIGDFLGPETLGNLAENINTAISGLPSQSVLDRINKTRAELGVQTGVPLTSELGANALATQLGTTVEQTQQQGLQNFLAFQSALPQPVRFEQSFGALLPFNTPTFGQTLQNAQFNESQRIGLETQAAGAEFGGAQALANIPANPQFTSNPFAAGLAGAGASALGAASSIFANQFQQEQQQANPLFQQQQQLNNLFLQRLRQQNQSGGSGFGTGGPGTIPGIFGNI